MVNKMKKETKRTILKSVMVCLCFLAICLAIYLPLKISGAFDKIKSAEDLKDIILSCGGYSYLVFFAIQILQVVILPIPAFVSTVVGTLVFGPWITVLISFIAVMIASILCFFLGRKFAAKVAEWIVGEETLKKWQVRLENGKYVYFLMMLFPFFPDDILCFVVGTVTSMSFKFFFFTNLITRPIGIACTCFLGSGYIIPFSEWGIIVWIILLSLGIVAFYLSYKYKKQIENFILRLSSKISKNKTDRNNHELEKQKLVSEQTESKSHSTLMDNDDE